MAYDLELADRIRDIVIGEPGLAEKRMFGGLAFLINGNMSVSASGRGGLLARVSVDDAERLVDDALIKPMTMGGREMRGWLHVDPEAVCTDELLQEWVVRCVAFARTLPAKA
ncbi:MAG TPA: TfoX/Sxy family protein [Pseudonocardiaceae bacterium]|jgi:hypothetical protein|nr:TfoX/Sxy family protein [Pseudonocardiaceae bacterium]